MCGLVGVAGRVMPLQDKIFKQLLYVDGLRGMHSTGVLFVPNLKTKEGTLLKGASGPDTFLNDKQVDDALSKLNRVLLGHNRYATVGEINADNAHPFDFSSIVGAHNGTLTNKHSLPDSKDFKVDSANLYHSIDKIGLEATYEIMQGAWALSWWDKDKERINFIRNWQRPMSYCFSRDRKTLYWASEAAMLSFVLDRNKVSYTDIVDTKPHHLYSLAITNNSLPIEDIAVTDMTPKYTPVIRNTYTKQLKKLEHTYRKPCNKYANQVREFVLGDMYVNQYNQEVYRGDMLLPPYEKVRVFMNPKGKTMPFKAGEVIRGRCTSYNPEDNVFSMSPHGLIRAEPEVVEEVFEPDTVKAFGGEEITMAQFKARASTCAWCGDPMFFGDKLMWIDTHTALCETCKGIEETSLYRDDYLGAMQ